jgi:hypothetical protein
MKFFRKILAIATLAIVSLGLTAEAQNWQGRNFLAPVTSITVSNTLGYTNLLSNASAPGTGFTTTNIVGLPYTNLIGTQVIVAGTNFDQFTTDVPLWYNRNGDLPVTFPGYTNGTVDVPIGAASITIHLTGGGSGANSAVNFVFAPVCDGLNETTISGDRFTVGVTAVTTSAVTVTTNVPVWKWPGCKSLRLRTITNTDTDATSSVTVGSVTLEGFVP